MKEATAYTELPRDAEGREIPLDTKMLYTADNIEVRVDDFVYGLIIRVNESGHNIVSNKWRVHSGCNAFDVDRLYLIERDSWEKLFEDLKAVEDYGNASCVNNPVCRYTNMVYEPCAKCKFYREKNCVSKMCADILDRICKLKGEGK